MRHLASGGMGQVYLADDESLHRVVAVKVLPPGFADEISVKRFLQEARLCSQISHPNVITIHDVGEQDGTYYIVMQYVDGLDLKSLASQAGGRLPWQAALRLIRPAAKGLHAVHEHSKGLIHRDVKPSNIMLSRDGQVILMDFGLAREELHSDLTSRGKTVGTPAFMSPEQCRCERLDRRSDIYSLGATLYTLLTGEKVARAKNNYELLMKIGAGVVVRPVHELRPEIPRDVWTFVSQAIAFNRLDRFPDAQTMSRELGALIRSLRASSPDEVETDLLSFDSIRADDSQSTLQLAEIVPDDGLRSMWTRRLTVMLSLVGVTAAVFLAAVGLALVANSNDPPDPTEVTAAMVHIPAGQVQLGNDSEKLANFFRQHNTDADLGLSEDDIAQLVSLAQEREPMRTVDVDAFWIDPYEVTMAEYARFIKDTGRAPPQGWSGTDPPAGQEDHPVVNVTYDDAEAYAAWAGKKLPTREQWVRAFRGDRDWLFPWGDDYDTKRANVYDNLDVPLESTPVGATPRDVSESGVFNLVGNVQEFIRGSEYSEGILWRVGKGGDWKEEGYLYGFGSSQVHIGQEHSADEIGFRCVVEESSSGARP